jgi:hypothetical protein
MPAGWKQWPSAGLVSGAYSSTVCPGISPGSLFTQGKSPGHQIRVQRYNKIITSHPLAKKTPMRISADRSLNKQINYGKIYF